MASEGPNNPGTAASDNGVGVVPWSNASFSTTSNDQYATADIDNEQTEYLKATNFGFSLPEFSSVDGITVEIERSTDTTESVFDVVVSLVVGGVVTGDNKADVVTPWPSSDAYKTYGGSSDDWGLTLDEDDINASDFGMVLSAQCADREILQVDHIRITVDYTVDEPSSSSSSSSDSSSSSSESSQSSSSSSDSSSSSSQSSSSSVEFSSSSSSSLSSSSSSESSSSDSSDSSSSESSSSSASSSSSSSEIRYKVGARIQLTGEVIYA